MTIVNSADYSPGQPTQPQLQHSFMAGLRFDTEVEYLDEDGRWQALCSYTDDEHRVPTKHSDAPLIHKVNALIQTDPEAVPDTLQEWQEWLDDSAGNHRADMVQSPLSVLANLLLNGLASDAVTLVQLALPKDGNRWMLVIGVECEQSSPAMPRLRSLLVLDPQVAAVWACGHNARVTLPVSEQNNAVGLQHKLSIYRTLDGGCLACTVQRVVVIQSRT